MSWPGAAGQLQLHTRTWKCPSSWQFYMFGDQLQSRSREAKFSSFQACACPAQPASARCLCARMEQAML